MMVNIGAFTGKCFVDPLRSVVGDEAYIYINFLSATLCFVALITIFLFFHSTNTSGQGKSMAEVFKGLGKVFTNGRLLLLILIVTLVNLVTRLMARRKALTSMTVGMFLIPLSALIMAAGNLFNGDILGMHPITVMMIAGIAVQALAECFISPRYMEFFSLQAPKGEEGLYLGFSHLHSFLASILGFGLSGILLTAYCPDPALFSSTAEWEAASANAHYIWYWFTGIGAISAIALIFYAKLTRKE